jgi:uncharacterized membrane protein
MRRLRNEDGSTLLLTIFYSALCLALILLVVAATSLYLERKRLFTLADGASLVGAEAFTLGDPTMATPSGTRPVLTSPEVASAVSDYVAENPADHFTDLHVDRAASVDGRSATVELSCYWAPPVLTLFIPKGFRIQVTSIARSIFAS